MARFRLLVAEANLRKGILLGIAFVGLNILDARLTGIALVLGASELNPIAATGFGSSMLLKGLIAIVIVIALLFFRRGNLLKWLSLGMPPIVLWNGLAIWSWS
ncbi:unnamed protein product [marine sediment metagenome]|uniref:Uncharacterized protein n=1 Tax=marine sediment metagenome TaxID=412755 RepID=X1E915_9ZZZZ